MSIPAFGGFRADLLGDVMNSVPTSIDVRMFSRMPFHSRSSEMFVNSVPPSVNVRRCS